jgi:DNA-binding GntR family transcriptional regulator
VLWSLAMVMAIDSATDVPVYQQLAAILRGQIDSGVIPPRRAIPSKRALCEEYRVSPGTVERAIAALRAEGYLKTVMGRGLYVRPAEERQPG